MKRAPDAAIPPRRDWLLTALRVAVVIGFALGFLVALTGCCPEPPVIVYAERQPDPVADAYDEAVRAADEAQRAADAALDAALLQ